MNVQDLGIERVRQINDNRLTKTSAILSGARYLLCDQCDQIGRFIGLWAAF